LLNESIDSIGLAVSSQGIRGTIESFSLRADPGPTAAGREMRAGQPAKIARREGAISFWFRCQNPPGRRAILWSAGEDRFDESFHGHLTSDGRIGFFMDQGPYDVLITSDEAVADGRWHHVASSWGPAAVDLYLDGQRVARDMHFRGSPQGVLHEFRLGGGVDETSKQQFTGWLGEVAVWNRPLTETEVAQQFRAGKGLLEGP
jgi:hypothetical protein